LSKDVCWTPLAVMTSETFVYADPEGALTVTSTSDRWLHDRIGTMTIAAANKIACQRVSDM
jgi:hypothetical protein